MPFFGYSLLRNTSVTTSTTRSFVSGAFDADETLSEADSSVAIPADEGISVTSTNRTSGTTAVISTGNEDATNDPPRIIEMNFEESSQEDGVTILSSADGSFGYPVISTGYYSLATTTATTAGPQILAASPTTTAVHPLTLAEHALSISTAESQFTEAFQDLQSSGFLSLHPSSLDSSVITTMSFPSSAGVPSTPSASSVASSDTSSDSSNDNTDPALLPPSTTTPSPSSPNSTSSSSSSSSSSSWVEVNRIIQNGVLRLQMGDQMITLPSSTTTTNPSTCMRWYERMNTEEDWNAFGQQALAILEALRDDTTTTTTTGSDLSPEELLSLLIQQEEELFYARRERNSQPRRKHLLLPWPLYPGLLAATAVFASLSFRLLLRSHR